MRRSIPVSWFSGCLLLGLIALLCVWQDPAVTAAEAKVTPAQITFFEKQVLPILEKKCFSCHSAKKARGGLRLVSRAALLKGGDLGPAVLLEKLDASPLLKAIHYAGELQMPPSGKLPAEAIDVLSRWVKMGAPYAPSREAVAVAPAHKAMQITEADRNYWAYRPLSRPVVPAVRNRAWVRTPIDAFLLAKIEQKGLAPAGPADRVALIRRASYDLTGLPPTPEEVDAFVADARPDAYERLVDRLLSSPGYGEKWGRHWLDLVRYAETHGYERDSPKPFAWRFRDYVINAFNADKPYNRFLIEQLAGDELDKRTVEGLVATGYYRLGLWDDEPADPLQLKYDVLDGIVTTTSQVVLGMTVGCARCHDHKKDPIAQKDYYRLLAFFSDVAGMNRENLRRILTPAEIRQREEQLKAKQEHEGRLYQEQYRLGQQFLAALAGKKGIDTSRLIGSDIVDLTYRFYRDTWERLPEFDSLKAEDAGKVASGFFSLAPASRTEAIGLVFEGKLQVPQRGDYTFFLEASGGARLRVNGTVVIDRPDKGRQQGEGKVALSAGLVSVRLEYFHTYGTPSLSVAWQGPGVPRRSLSETGAHQTKVLSPDARRRATEWQYTTTRPGRGWMRPDFDATSWQKGKGGFGTPGTPGAVVGTRWDTLNIWLRRTFTVDELPAGLALQLHHDDDVEVYLNGKLIYRVAGYLVAYRRISLGPEALAALRKGSNVLAVHCRQTTGGQYIDVGLEDDAQASLLTLLKQHGAALLGAGHLARLEEVRADLERSRTTRLPEAGMPVMCVREGGPVPTRVLIRGNPHAPGDEVKAGFPEVLGNVPVKLPERKNRETSGKRRALAEWLTSPGNPLTARVMANRLWQFHFGRGIVPTPSDFGKLGEAPTHPELLDWLASELRDGAWKLKRLHRLILLSSAYRMSSKANPEALAKDPANTLFWRYNPRRLTAEEVRDTMLAVGGTLNRTMSGPPVYPTIPKAVLQGQSMPGVGWGKSPPHEQARRSVYVHVKRSLIVPILETHDLADTDSSCAVRYTTTVPTQALAMLNGDFTNEQAAALAKRLTAEAPGNLMAQVKRAIRLTTGRAPEPGEIQRDVAFIRKVQAEDSLNDRAALTLYCLLALNANELMYLD
jgi:hypothetical protein